MKAKGSGPLKSAAELPLPAALSEFHTEDQAYPNLSWSFMQKTGKAAFKVLSD